MKEFIQIEMIQTHKELKEFIQVGKIRTHERVHIDWDDEHTRERVH